MQSKQHGYAWERVKIIKKILGNQFQCVKSFTEPNNQSRFCLGGLFFTVLYVDFVRHILLINISTEFFLCKI